MKYHLIGIEGVAMKGLARVLKQMNHQVSGCDLKLKGHSERHISPSLDRVVFTSAVAPNSPASRELSYAQKLRIPTLKRSVATAEIFKNYKTIAVAGMHGKTTVASMLVNILEKTGQSPSYIIGMPDGKVGAQEVFGSQLGTSDLFVVEACEFDRSFLDFRPFIGVITNLEPEHLDYYKGGMEEILDTFEQFVFRTKPGGTLLISYDNPYCQKLLQRMKKEKPPFRVLTFGVKRGADLRASQIRVKNQTIRFKLNFQRTSYFVTLKIPGRHNVVNALAALGVASELGFPLPQVIEGLEEFPGCKRRLELVGEKKGIKVFDDYGHHPTEIKATLQALKEFYPHHRLIVVFQPHQVSRTQILFKEFLNSFFPADLLVITDIYEVPGREEEKNYHIRAEDLVWALKKKGVKTFYLPYEVELIVKYLKKVVKVGDIILTLGATDIYKVGLKFLKKL